MKNDEKPWLFDGTKPGPGRPKGARNKLGEAFLEALEADFHASGVEALERARIEDPMGYVKTIAGLLPKELLLKRADPLDEISADELENLIALLRASLSGPEAPRGQAFGPPGSDLSH